MAQPPVIDRYQLVKGLGRGAMGSVYLARDPKLGREVAIKVLQEDLSKNEKHRQRFEREARTIAAIKHPNIVEIFDYGGSPEKRMFLVMEYIRGPHTGRMCRDHGVFPESVVASLGMDLADALRTAHEAGVIHRDLKPENVFVDDGRVVLADFGIVKAIHEDNPLGAEAASPHTEIIGTPGFMAPEQLNQTPLDARTDVFAFGALLYFLASRKLPYNADTPYGLLKLFRETRPTPLIDRRPEISEALSALLQDCLEVEASVRPQDMAAVYARLHAVLDACGVGDRREILRSYQRDPLTFRAADRERLVRHLIGQLKIAVRDEDRLAVDSLRGRLAVLDPENEEAARISGIGQLAAPGPITRDDLLVPRRRRWAAPLLVLLAAGAGIALWQGVGPLSLPTPPPAQVSKPVGLLRVRANDKTHVFLDGRVLGTTPDFAPAMLPAGSVALEFVHDRKGRLQQIVKLKAGDEVTVVVDWRRRRVRIRQGGKRDKL